MRYRSTVIVVEDDPVNRLIAVDALDEGGFDVVDFSRADDALAYIESADRPVAALLTDVSVPGDRDGIDLAVQIGQRWPETLVLITSGRFGDNRPEELPSDALFLTKPWRGRDLVATIRAGLEADARSPGGPPPASCSGA